MKKIITIILFSLVLTSCTNNSDNNTENPSIDSKIIENNEEYKAPALEDIVENIEKEWLEAKNADTILNNDIINSNNDSENNLIPGSEKSNKTPENTEKQDENKNKEGDKEEFFWYWEWAVNVNFSIKKLVDYNTCILSQDEFSNLEDKRWYKYEDLCAPKYKFMWEILAWNPDKIEFYSCWEKVWYTLQKFNSWDKNFEYNIANAFDNICKNEDQRSYEMKYYNKSWEQLDEINAFKDILPEEFIYKKWGGLYFGDMAIRWNCLINNKDESQICYDNKTKTLK